MRVATDPGSRRPHCAESRNGTGQVSDGISWDSRLSIAQRFQRRPRSRRCWHWSVIVLGVFAVLVTPREEEPQINVTFANVAYPCFCGAWRAGGEPDCGRPAEQVLDRSRWHGHVYRRDASVWPCSRCNAWSARIAPMPARSCASSKISNQDWTTRAIGAVPADRQTERYRRRADRHGDAVGPGQGLKWLQS